jgi:hypothetical protein
MRQPIEMPMTGSVSGSRAEVDADLERIDHIVATLWRFSRKRPR